MWVLVGLNWTEMYLKYSSSILLLPHVFCSCGFQMSLPCTSSNNTGTTLSVMKYWSLSGVALRNVWCDRISSPRYTSLHFSATSWSSSENPMPSTRPTKLRRPTDTWNMEKKTADRLLQCLAGSLLVGSASSRSLLQFYTEMQCMILVNIFPQVEFTTWVIIAGLSTEDLIWSHMGTLLQMANMWCFVHMKKYHYTESVTHWLLVILFKACYLLPLFHLLCTMLCTMISRQNNYI